jgi:hypothetical protein
MKPLAALTVLLIAVPLLPAVSSAGPNANAKIVLNVRGIYSPDRGRCNTISSATTICAGMTTHGDLYPQIYNVYVLVTDGDATAGIAGLQFGIEYGSGKADGVGVDIYGWTLCATLEFPQPSPVWPESGGGNMVTWDPLNRCQRYEPGGAGTGVVANAGYFYLGAYGDAVLAITPRPVDGMAKVASCTGEEDSIQGVGLVRTPSHLGSAGFGTYQGYNPCGLNTPVEATTWSGVKSLYR